MLEELNVRSLVLAEDDSKYGVKLVAEPDNDRLGKRLKRDFKTVAPAIKGIFLSGYGQCVAFVLNPNVHVCFCTIKKNHTCMHRLIN